MIEKERKNMLKSNNKKMEGDKIWQRKKRAVIYGL